MERFLQHYNKEYVKMANKEYMKMAMLKHEEMFKEQVNELHRLYRVQKMLMKDLKRQQNSAYAKNDIGRWATENKTDSSQLHYGYQNLSRSGRPLDLERPAEEYTDHDNDGHVIVEIVQESDIELTLATGGSRRRKKEDVSFTSDSGASHSSSSTESGGETLKLHEWGLFQMPDMNMNCPGEKRSGFNIEEEMRQDRLKQPSWHFQCLSMKMT